MNRPVRQRWPPGSRVRRTQYRVPSQLDAASVWASVARRHRSRRRHRRHRLGSSLNLAINLQATGNSSLLVSTWLPWSGKTGRCFLVRFVIEDYSFFNSQAVADLDGDDYPEIIVGSAGYLHAFNGCGHWPKVGRSSPDSGSSRHLRLAISTVTTSRSRDRYRSGWLCAGTRRVAPTVSSSGRATTTTTETPAISRSPSNKAIQTAAPRSRSLSNGARPKPHRQPRCPLSRVAAAAAGSLPRSLVQGPLAVAGLALALVGRRRRRTC